MKAIQIDRYTKKINTVLRDIPIPEIKPNEVLIKVKAASRQPIGASDLDWQCKANPGLSYAAYIRK